MSAVMIDRSGRELSADIGVPGEVLRAICAENIERTAADRRPVVPGLTLTLRELNEPIPSGRLRSGRSTKDSSSQARRLSSCMSKTGF